MKRNFAVLTISGRVLKPLLMLPYPHPTINKQAVFVKLSKTRVVARSVQHPKILRLKENFDSVAIHALLSRPHHAFAHSNGAQICCVYMMRSASPVGTL